jgi:hypothetical protein
MRHWRGPQGHRTEAALRISFKFLSLAKELNLPGSIRRCSDLAMGIV